MTSRLSSQTLGIVRNPHFWVVAVMFAIGANLHYPQLPFFWETEGALSFLGLTRHAIIRVFFLAPMTYAGFFFGIRGGIASLATAFSIMLPRVILISLYPADALFESISVIGIGSLVNLWFHFHRKDITRRESAEEMLSKIIDGSPIPSFVIDKEHRITHWNTAIESLSGIKKEKIVGTDRQWSAFYLDRRPVVADLIVDGASADEVELYYGGKARKSRLIKEAYEAEDFFPILGEGGRWLHFTASPLRDNSGEIIGAIETLQDVTERKRAEEALHKSEKSFRDLFESAYDAIWVHDLEGNIQTANEAAAKLSGYPVEELLGKNVRSFLDDESLNLAREVGDKLTRQQPVDMPYEQRLVRKNGSEAICMVNTNLITSDGKPKGFQNIARDVTEEKRMQENLRYYLQQITKAQEEERKRIAHELHDSTAQALIAQLHQLESLLQDKVRLPVRKAKSLWVFYEQTRDILQEVRRFSRDLRPSILDDLGLMPALEWVTGELKNEYGTEVSLNVAGNERRFSPEVELVLFRIVQEALRNIGKHAQALRAEVKVKFDVKKVVVTISDDGVGFQPPESLGELSRIGKLGLAGMQERAQLIGGKLTLQSKVGKGTIVTIEAPV